MPAVDTKNFEKSLKRYLKDWADEIKGPLGDIEKINDQLAKLDARKDLTPEDAEKLRKRCIEARKKLQKKVENANASLRTNLIILTPPPDAAKSDLQKLTKLVKDAVATFKKGLPLADGVRLEPDVDIDFKKLKFKKLGVVLKWTF